jgi:hypothetical protein
MNDSRLTLLTLIGNVKSSTLYFLGGPGTPWPTELTSYDIQRATLKLLVSFVTLGNQSKTPTGFSIFAKATGYFRLLCLVRRTEVR